MKPAKPTAGRRARTGVKNEQMVAERAVGAMMAKDVFSQWMGMTIVNIRPRAATVRMKVRAEMVNGFGVAHGGVVYSLADSALAFASNTHGKITVAINNSITYPAAAHVGDVLTAIAECVGETRRLAFFRVAVRNQKDDIVSSFSGTVYKTKDDLVAAARGTADNAEHAEKAADKAAATAKAGVTATATAKTPGTATTTAKPGAATPATDKGK